MVPHASNIARSLLKSPEIYFFDTELVKGDEGIKFENFVALSLLKHIHSKIDYQAKNYSLKFLHTKEKKEVDFAISHDKKVEKIIEVKLKNHTMSSSLRFFHEKYQIPAVQVVKDLKKKRIEGGIEIVHSKKNLESLDL